ncbi:MAG: hypothetical protein EVB11_05440 [Winogradskyella sp.]|nr:MAG: hypothetical protein EVB11_05440 [Winogradskyella sp.]
MKQSITNKVKLSHYFYSFMLIMFCYNSTFSQAITKQYEKELSVTSDSKIFIEGPGNLPFQSEGKLKVNTVNGYALEPRDNNGIAAFVANKLDIKTSKNTFVKQIITVKVIPHEKYSEEAKALLEGLKINIHKDANQYQIDNNLNIERLSFKNGFFKGTQNLIVLDDGSSYNVRGIEISTTIIVPDNVTLSVASKYIDVAIEDFKGELNINADKSTIMLSDVGELYGRFNSCKVDFKTIDNANIIAYNTTINGDNVNLLDINTEEFILKESLFNRTKKASLSTYVIKTVGVLNILQTSNDEFKIDQVGTIDVKSSHFSNYQIKRLKNELSLNAKNGDISIDTISKEVTKLDINNRVSTINLGVQELDNYLIRFPVLEYTEKTIPSTAKDVSSEGEVAFQKGNGKTNGIISISCKNCKVNIKD